VREIVLDTETTGLSATGGDRLVEIGCVELVNRFPTGRVFHVYVNPQRDVPREAFAVHGLSTEFLSDKPLFAAVADDFLAFIDGAHLVIHNAEFDMGFLNMELARLKRPPIGNERVINTLILARRKHPGVSNRLDDLCARYGIDNSHRTKHGALLDAELLADVYVELIGGRQAALSFGAAAAADTLAAQQQRRSARPVPLAPRLTPAEIEAHARFVASLSGEAIWSKYAEAQAVP
jgi:DNA polymerase III subunit epsilon